MKLDTHSNIIVTGPTGVVGLALLDELVNCGANVTAICREGSVRRSLIDGRSGITVVECNLGDYSNLPKMLDGHFDAFFHLAWAGNKRPPEENWTTQASNIQNALQAAQVAKALGCKAFIGIGSQAEYGDEAGILTSHGSCKPVTDYGASKYATLQMVGAYCRRVGMKFNWCRIASIYGPGDFRQSLVMTVIASILEQKSLRLSSCKQMWDYLYSRDAATALRLVAERGCDQSVYLIGSGQGAKLRDFVDAIVDEMHASIEIEFEDTKAGRQSRNLIVDISDLQQDTGFEPVYSFRQGIIETVEWVKKNNR